MIPRLTLAAVGLAALAVPAFAQGNPNTTNLPAQPSVQGPPTVQRGWNTNAHPANRTGGDAFGTTAFGDRSTNAFGRGDSARQNADRMAGAFPTQTSHGTWPETGPNPPGGAPRQ